MKKIILISLCLLFALYTASAQSWQWSKKITQSEFNSHFGFSKGLETDKNGNIFSYGANYSTSTDTIGSYLQCYSSNGVLLFSKQWEIPFHIQKMDYDGNDYFYFAGKFFGTQTIDGITIVSQGNEDGVIGKMDLAGNIIWMKTFGGGGSDGALGICLIPGDASIYVTGGIKDTLFFNNSFESVNQQSAIICQYSAEGELIRHKLYDFIPQRDIEYRNCGVEISYKTGNIYVLMDRDGVQWYGDTINASDEGRYVIKLNSNLDTIWSTFIISDACYYGWSCNSLSVAANGDAYVSRECSGKYGGTAELLRLNANTGNISWNLVNHDGFYTDVFIDSNTVYLIGNEGANGCPCEENHPGYYVIKKINDNNIVVGETRISTVYLSNICKSSSGNIFVTGRINEKQTIIGPDTILADSLQSGDYYYYYGKFLSKLSDINCIVPTVSVSAPDVFSHYYSLCHGDTASLTVNPTVGSFNWSNGSTGLQTNVGSTGNYCVSNIQPNGCIAYSLPVSVIVNENINSHKICMVTYNKTTHKNTIVVKYDDYNNSEDIKQINLFKKDGNSIVPVSSTTTGNITWGTVFTDHTSVADSVSVEYYISTIDTCDTESALSLMHKSIFLDVYKNFNNKNVLNWNASIGNPVTGYRIWRGTTENTLTIYDSVNAPLTTYTEQNSSIIHYFYRIETINQYSGCYVDGVAYYSSRSNIANDNIIQTIPLVLSQTHSDVLCHGQCTGSVILSASGGFPPYTYSGLTTGLCMGTYFYSVTDSNDSIATTTVTINQGVAITAIASAIPVEVCAGSCSDLAISVTGGTPGYTYLWMPGSLTSATPNICPAETTTYTCTVEDSNACSQNTLLIVTVNALPNVTMIATDTITSINGNTDLLTGTPAGGIFSGTGVSGTNFDPSVAGLGTWLVTYTYTDENGCINTATTNITVNTAEPTPLVLSQTHTDVSCHGQCTGSVILSASGGLPPYTYSGVTTGLCMGTYFYSVTDSNDSIATTTVTINQGDAITAIASAIPIEVCAGSCSDLAISVIGGTPGYRYLWMPGSLTDRTPNICPNGTTTYTCSVTDSKACVQNAMITVTENGIPTVTIAATDTIIEINLDTDSLRGTPTGGIFSGTGVSGTNFDPSLAGLGTWTVTYTYTDENGCTNTASLDITVNMSTDVSTTGTEMLDFEVYPNPSSGIIIIHLKKKTVETKICVYDALGKCLLEKVFTKNDKGKIDLTDLPKGLYSMEIEADGHNLIKKLVLQ
ncbi:MAG: T9SS type A sorting domain-containing protein [Bacteroidia bacterium]|nr:T9SS type A sorting domain-containing protein [Bacteroidia bacterium]